MKAPKLAGGTRVEVCPYRGGRAYYNHGHLDGKRGTVGEQTGFGPDPEARVLIDGQAHPRPLPYNALKEEPA